MARGDETCRSERTFDGGAIIGAIEEVEKAQEVPKDE